MELTDLHSLCLTVWFLFFVMLAPFSVQLMIFCWLDFGLWTHWRHDFLCVCSWFLRKLFQFHTCYYLLFFCRVCCWYVPAVSATVCCYSIWLLFLLGCCLSLSEFEHFFCIRVFFTTTFVRFFSSMYTSFLCCDCGWDRALLCLWLPYR